MQYPQGKEQLPKCIFPTVSEEMPCGCIASHCCRDAFPRDARGNDDGSITIMIGFIGPFNRYINVFGLRVG